MLDYFFVACYGGVLFFAVFVVTGGSLTIAALSTPGSRHLVGALTLTLPVVVYFAISDSSRRQGTIGKQATRLSVTDRAGRRIGIFRSLARSTFKFLPWELAHTFVHRLPKDGDVPWPLGLVLATSLGLAALYLAGLFMGARRPLYDLVAGTRVVQALATAAAP